MQARTLEARAYLQALNVFEEEQIERRVSLELF
jgi:hypothetical protein